MVKILRSLQGVGRINDTCFYLLLYENPAEPNKTTICSDANMRNKRHRNERGKNKWDLYENTKRQAKSDIS
jgi:hypothetical protein